MHLATAENSGISIMAFPPAFLVKNTQRYVCTSKEKTKICSKYSRFQFFCHSDQELLVTKIHSLKLTWHLKMDGWNICFLLESPIFRCEIAVSFRCRVIHQLKSMVVSGSPKRWDRWHITPNWQVFYHLYTTYGPCLRFGGLYNPYLLGGSSHLVSS